ncbi:uncharacterized protein LOC143783294 [Ranitomeya variabilis]|uniref:uncharacterized protein LOC143783294 n=1 Tax=Ranitomeya variabilis TaxID=490064 RepID=UPI0040571303
MAASMDWYDRMALDVPLMISVVEKHPEVWDRASEEYKASASKRDAWPAIVTEIYPQWPQLPKAGQKLILEDVKKRWRSVTDRLMKAQKVESGSSPSKKKVPFADQLQFILTSRNLRRTEGNVRAETPPVQEDNSLELGDGEEDYPICSSPNPPLARQSSSMHAAVMSPTCTVSSSPSSADAAVLSSAVVAASSAASSSFVGGSRPTVLGSGSARPVPMVRAAPKKGKKNNGSASAIEALTSRTLNIIDHSSPQDDMDKFGSVVASRLRSMTWDRQSLCMTAVNALLMCAAVPSPIPPPQDVVVGIMKAFTIPSGPPPPPPAAATQRFFHAAHRPDAAEGSNSSHCPTRQSSGHNLSQNTSILSQDMFPGYGYEPQYQQF